MPDDPEMLQDDADAEESMTEEQRTYLREMIQKLMEKGVFVVYGDEDDGTEEVAFDDGGRKEICRAVCCSFIFALTKSDKEKGIAKWNPKRPFFIARDEDGFCPHLDRKTLECEIWENRPERCRKYDCRKDRNVWIDWEKKIINTSVFDHLK